MGSTAAGKGNRAAVPADTAASNDELSREAIAAAMPELATSTADLVGWVTRAEHESSTSPLPPGPARRILAAALGVPEKGLSRMSDADVVRAVERLRGLADQCRRLAGRATDDELTGALRRGAGLAALQHEIDRTRRIDGGKLVAVFVDMDGLKAINDRDGHAAGDDVLRRTVAALRERLRSYDLVVRYGGDEFVCVLTGSSLEQAARTAAHLSAHVLSRTGNGISTGLARLEPGDTVDSLIARADASLYETRRARQTAPATLLPAPPPAAAASSRPRVSAPGRRSRSAS